MNFFCYACCAATAKLKFFPTAPTLYWDGLEIDLFLALRPSWFSVNVV